MWYCGWVLTSLRVSVVHTSQLLVFLCVWPLEHLFHSFWCTRSQRNKKDGFDFSEGTRSYIFTILYHLLPLLHTFNLLRYFDFVLQKAYKLFTLFCLFSVNIVRTPWQVSKLAVCQFSFFHTVSRMTTPYTPNSLLCTSISGSVVELFHNSKHYQPWCQSTFVSCIALLGLFWGRSCTCSVHFLSHACVCVYYVYVSMRLHVCMPLCLSEFASVRACVFFFCGITVFWAVLSVDSVVSFGPTAASNAE